MASSASSCLLISGFPDRLPRLGPDSFGSSQSLPLVSCSVPTPRVVRVDQLGTLSSLDSQVDVIEHVEHLI